VGCSREMKAASLVSYSAMMSGNARQGGRGVVRRRMRAWESRGIACVRAWQARRSVIRLSLLVGTACATHRLRIVTTAGMKSGIKERLATPEAGLVRSPRRRHRLPVFLILSLSLQRLSLGGWLSSPA